MAEAGCGGAVKIFANRRVRDGDEGAGTLGEAFASELGYAVFCDYVLDHMTGRHYAGAFCEHRLYLRHALFSHGRNRYERLAAF